MVKTTINNDWKKYIYRQIEIGVNKKTLESILKNQNYSQDIIQSILNSDDSIDKIQDDTIIKNSDYYNYIVNKLNDLELTNIEKSIITFLKSQSFLKEKIINNRIIIIDNWFEEYIANYIYDIFIYSEYKEIKTSNHNKLNFTFENIVQTPLIKKFLFLFNSLFQDTFLFNGSIGMSKYSKGSYIDEHTDHGGYIYDNEKYYRNISAVIYFNKEWKEEYGGSFIDIENDKKILPIFNRVVFFHVPYKHRVEEIIVDKERYAIFLFFSNNKKQYYLNDERFKKTSSLI
jgi:Rps23 Pro-64 3,4-dihydroxylase Tpa1-like proline 4-hydroxylase